MVTVFSKHLSCKQKTAVRLVTNRAISRGEIMKLPCEICGDDKSQVHHVNYDDPYAVTWLCKNHHLEAHGKSARDKNSLASILIGMTMSDELVNRIDSVRKSEARASYIRRAVEENLQREQEARDADVTKASA